MIIKNYQLNKKDLNKVNYFLFYGRNEGYKTEKIYELLKDISKENIFIYDEKLILDNQTNFFNQILNKSLFDEEKFIIIQKGSDKLLKIVEEVVAKHIEGISLIINSGQLDKKSKLRSFFEKDQNLICVAFYEDTYEILFNIASNFFKKNNISISSSNINLIINKCGKDRAILNNELNKIKIFSLNDKKINTENLLKLTNLIENHSINELIDCCLAKNKVKTINVLNDNNFDSNDTIVIIRTFLLKAKRILKLCEDYKITKNLNKTIINYKPPIFWKEKEIVQQQIIKWTPVKLKNLIYRLNNIELQIKKNMKNSVLVITDFILDQSS